MENKTNFEGNKNLTETKKLVLEIVKRFQYEKIEREYKFKQVKDEDNIVTELLEDRKVQILEKEKSKEEILKQEEEKKQQETIDFRATIDRIINDVNG